MKDMFKNVDPKHIVAYFIAVFNVMLATFGLEGIQVSGKMAESVQGWMDAIQKPAEDY